MIWLIVSSVLSGCVGGGVFILAYKKGWLDNLEDTKYQVFRNEEAASKQGKSDAEI